MLLILIIEVSTIVAGLKYGQYFSQFDIRELAVLNPRNKQTSGELLIGVNDEMVSKKINLNFNSYTTTYSGAEVYIAWIKAMMRKGYAVTVCKFKSAGLF